MVLIRRRVLTLSSTFCTVLLSNSDKMSNRPIDDTLSISADPIEPKNVTNDCHQAERPENPSEIAAAAEDADATQQRDRDDVQLEPNGVVSPRIRQDAP